MRWLSMLLLRLRSLFLGAAVDGELDEELRFHIDQETAVNIARGLSPDEARRAALRAMDGVQRQKDACRDARGVAWIEHTVRDVRLAIRGLARSPGFAFAVIGSLALGIGANAAMFQLLDALAFRTLPVSRPHEIADVHIPGKGGFGLSQDSNSQMTNPLWERLRDEQQAFSGMFAWGSTGFLVGPGADAQFVGGLWVSGSMFPVLGVRPALGRLFTPDDDRRGCAADSVVISDGFWRSDFGGSTSAIGSTLLIFDRPFRVIGVTPPEFFGLEVGKQFDIALPICAAAIWGNSLDQRHVFWLTVMGRLKPGWSIERASAHVDALSAELFEATTPPGYEAASVQRYRSFRLTATPAAYGVSEWRTRYERALWWLFGTTGIVLLIACANISNLMLARATARERELAVRVAIGATRARLIGHTLTEGVVLAAAGALLGTLLAGVMSRGLVAALTSNVNPLVLAIAVDWRVLAFTAGVAAVTCLVFALMPALRSSQVGPLGALQATSRATTPRHRRVQRALVVGQIALSLVLLAGAGLFVRSFRNLVTVNTGLRQDGVVFVQFATFQLQRPGPDAILASHRVMLDAIRSTPGVVAAGATSQFPLNGSSWTQGIRLASGSDVRRSSKFTYIGPGYFAAFGIPRLGGRDFTDADTRESRKVAIVNETFARRYASGSNVIGTLMTTTAEPGYPETTYEVVGLVRDTKYADLREEVPPITYVPITQHPNLRPWPAVVIRSSIPAVDVIPEIRRRVAAIDSKVILGFSVFETQMRNRLVRERTMAWLAAGFGALATLLATIGLYGVIAYMAVRRRHEIGIRRALGASRARIVTLILGETALTITAGLALGLAATIVVVRGAAALLFELSPHDPLTLTASAGLLAAVAVAAGLLPALHAARIDPTTALRCD